VLGKRRGGRPLVGPIARRSLRNRTFFCVLHGFDGDRDPLPVVSRFPPFSAWAMALFVRRPGTHVLTAPSNDYWLPSACSGSAVRFPISVPVGCQQPGQPSSEAKESHPEEVCLTHCLWLPVCHSRPFVGHTIAHRGKMGILRPSLTGRVAALTA
jgi:hypothetical protein